MSFSVAKIFRGICAWLLIIAGLSACEYAARDLSGARESQIKIESVRSRAFETTDREKMLRTLIATLQDLGFVVDHADHALGSVSGTKLDHYSLRMTVTVRPQGPTQLLVRANARYNVTPVLDPDPYQKFFAALSRAMSLEAQQVN